jgi:hypothetical protein
MAATSTVVPLVPTAPLLERAIAALDANPLRGFVFDKPPPTAATNDPGVRPTAAPVLQLLELDPACSSNNDQSENSSLDGDDTVAADIIIDATQVAAVPSSAHETGNSQHVDSLDFSVPETQLQQVVVDDMEKLKQAWLARAQEVVIEESFTPYVSKTRKKQLRLENSTGKHHTRSKGPLPPHSQ